MLYDRNSSPRADEPIDPERRADRQEPHWAWFAAVFALILLGFIALRTSSDDVTLTANADRDASTATVER